MKLSKSKFLWALSYASQQARLDRSVGYPIRYSIEEKTELPLPSIRDISLIKTSRVDEELTDNPIYIAVERASRKIPMESYEEGALAEMAWQHYQKLPDAYTEPRKRHSMSFTQI
jgi:hypothetical protein